VSRTRPTSAPPWALGAAELAEMIRRRAVPYREAVPSSPIGPLALPGTERARVQGGAPPRE
jgi:hypothetical protein